LRRRRKDIPPEGLSDRVSIFGFSSLVSDRVQIDVSGLIALRFKAKGGLLGDVAKGDSRVACE
jgi:hypothetical protein